MLTITNTCMSIRFLCCFCVFFIRILKKFLILQMNLLCLLWQEEEEMMMTTTTMINYDAWWSLLRVYKQQSVERDSQFCNGGLDFSQISAIVSIAFCCGILCNFIDSSTGQRWSQDYPFSRNIRRSDFFQLQLVVQHPIAQFLLNTFYTLQVLYRNLISHIMPLLVHLSISV